MTGVGFVVLVVFGAVVVEDLTAVVVVLGAVVVLVGRAVVVAVGAAAVIAAADVVGTTGFRSIVVTVVDDVDGTLVDANCTTLAGAKSLHGGLDQSITPWSP